MFRTTETEIVYREFRLSLRNFFIALNKCSFDFCLELLEKQIIRVNTKFLHRDSEYFLNDLFVLTMIYKFFESYTYFWKHIYSQEFSKSWSKLQDSNDYIAIIKKFSVNNIDSMFFYLENQLHDLEKLYPFNLFCSVGLLVEKYLCSICGYDIDSFDCQHIQGELYSGKIAQGVPEGAVQLDHVAFVDPPKDKRCTVIYEDSSPAYTSIRYISNQIINSQITPLSFDHMCFSKRKRKNPDYKKIGRNDVCYCGSGKKFKFCCENKEYLYVTHSEIVVDLKMLELLINPDIKFEVC